MAVGILHAKEHVMSLEYDVGLAWLVILAKQMTQDRLWRILMLWMWPQYSMLETLVMPMISSLDGIPGQIFLRSVFLVLIPFKVQLPVYYLRKHDAEDQKGEYEIVTLRA